MRPTSAPSVRRLSLPDSAKTASFSPGIDAMNAPYSPEAAQAQFDQSITQSAYQRFGSKFPDLVPSLVTMRLLASDVEAGTAFGAFILDIGDRVVYVPTVVNDSRFEDLDLVYDKSTDQFAPLTLQQLRYMRTRGTNPMGTAEKLPQTVPTDVDIRALMLPPETGRYSYASAPDFDITKTAGFASELAYASPKKQLEDEVLKHLAKNAPELFDSEMLSSIGAGGSDDGDPLAPHMTSRVPHGSDGPVAGTIRLASADFDADLKQMLRKIASTKEQLTQKRASGAPQKLLTFLRHSPNAVKLAFANVLKSDKALAAQAFRFYGPEKLASAARRGPDGAALLAEKRAGVTEIPFRLAIAQKEDQVEAFGPDSGKALRGVKLRGYYYRTSGMAPNRAIMEPDWKSVQVQRPESGEAGAGLSGVLMLRKRAGGREPVLVISQPLELTHGDAWDSRSITQPDAHEYGRGTQPVSGNPHGRDERGRKNLILFGDGTFAEAYSDVFGDPVPDSALEGTKLWSLLKAMGKPKVGRGMFLHRSGAAIEGSEPVVIKTISTSPDGITRGTFQGGRAFECDPLAAIEKMVMTSQYDTLYIPASWKWIELGTERNNRSWDGEASVSNTYYLTSEDAAHALMHALVDKSERASVMGDGVSYVTSAKPGMGKTKVAALVDLSTRYGISGADAEALLKIADCAGRASALIVPSSGRLKQADDALSAAFGSTLQDLQAQLSQLQGQITALVGVQQRAQAMGAAMPSPNPLDAQMTDPGMGAPAPGDAPMPDVSATAAPAPGAVDPAQPAGDTSAQAQQPADGSTMAVPQAAPTADAGGAAPAQDPSAGAPAAGTPQASSGAPNTAVDAAPGAQGMPAPAPGGDPNAAMAQPGMDPMQPQMPAIDPSTGLNVDPQTGSPTGTAMATEGPAASQVQGQINPNYLQAAGALDDASVFDVGMLAEMQRAAAVSASSAALEALLPINTKDLAETVDDLGRALLNLYLRGTALNEQLGVQTQARMVGQIRRSFLGLGELLLDLRSYKAGARASLGNI